MRGTGLPTIHVTHVGEPSFIGLAFHVESEKYLKRFATAPAPTVSSKLDEPDGGQRVRISDPLSNGTGLPMHPGKLVSAEEALRSQWGEPQELSAGRR
jgi:hypothetical protein